jgi:hypothetical protein
MDLIADILLAAGAFGAAAYCHVLAGRLKRFTTLENGMGGAIAVLSAQVDDMTRALNKAQGAASESADSLESLTRRAEQAAARLELLMASMHDLPEPRAERAERAERPERDARLRFVRRRNDRAVEAAE